MANQKKKKKSRMSPETKDKLVTGFKTLVNNDAAIKAGRNYHWWMPVILAICSVLLSLVPTFTTQMQTKVGESVLKTSYGVENGLASFHDALTKTGKSVKVSEDGKLDIQAGISSGVYNSADNSYYEYKNSTSGDVFRVLFEKDGLASDYITNFSTYEVEETITSALEEGGSEVTVPTQTKYRCSILIFEESSFIFAVYPNRTTSATSRAYTYLYDRVHGMDLKDLGPSDISLESNPQQYIQKVRDNYSSFLTTCYTTTKISNVWKNVGILTGINSGVILLMGLVLFLITRGKRNPFRVITFWESQKIAYWAAPAPAIISLIFGFLMSSSSSISMFIFLFVYGMRIMWLSMKGFSTPADGGK